MKTYRVFSTRHYIAVEWYDVRAETKAKARSLAQRTVRRRRKDDRAVATDNGWHADDPIVVPRIGSGAGTHKMTRVAKGVYRGG